MVTFSINNLQLRFIPVKRKYQQLDTERKLNVHKIFRGRPGSLLNVLSTFNLRPVSRGYNSIKNINVKTLKNGS